MALVTSKDLELGDAISQRSGLTVKSNELGIKKILEENNLSEDEIVRALSEDFTESTKPIHRLKLAETFLKLHGHLTSKDEKDHSDINIILKGDSVNVGFFNPKREIRVPE